MDIRIYPPDGFIEAEVDLPLSKSVLNRALIMNAMTPGEQTFPKNGLCDDSFAIINALETAAKTGIVDIGAAGTAMRFLTAYFAATPGFDLTIDGSERMRKRPIGPLVDALCQTGAHISYQGQKGFPPLKIEGRRLKGGKISVDASISSQFISAMLMVAPTMEEGLEITLDGEIVSKAYIDMTLKMMRARGIEAEMDGNVITVKPGEYHVPENDNFEKDWSAASYWAEVVALSAGWVYCPGLSKQSIQGDRKVIEFFEKLGVDTTLAGENPDCEGQNPDTLVFSPHPESHSHISIDLTENPDLAQTIAVTSALLGIPFRLTGLSTLKIKETDRLTALQSELAKLGFRIDIAGNSEILWEGNRIPVLEMPVIETYKDHRMAMSFAPAALYVPGIVIKDADVVNKSYPGFWDDLKNAGFILRDASEPIADDTEQ